MGYQPQGVEGEGYFASLSEAIKECIHLPVILTGGITQPETAERLLAQGKADLIGVGRAQIADPDWAQKAREVLA